MGLGFFHFARHYSGNHCCFLFLCLLRCFSSARSRIYATILQIVRFPHSEIRGSCHICWSPRLIAAYHVLHRLWEPRHPPCTLSYFLLRYRLLPGRYAFLIPAASSDPSPFDPGATAEALSLVSCFPVSVRVSAVLYTVVFSFNLLLPICQRTSFRFEYADLGMQMTCVFLSYLTSDISCLNCGE
jgi:hypothetical protein